MEKNIQADNILWMVFVDLETPFDNAPRKKIWEILKKKQIGNRLLTTIMNNYICCDAALSKLEQF